MTDHTHETAAKVCGRPHTSRGDGSREALRRPGHVVTAIAQGGRAVCAAVLMLATCDACVAQEAPAAQAIDRQLSVIDNGYLRVGVDLARGGSIVWVSLAAEADVAEPLTRWRGVNLVNNWDHGRQIQPAFYAGPVPYQPEGTELEEAWYHLGYNPVPTGDTFGHPGVTLSHANDGLTIRTVCRPMQFALRNVPAECRVEQVLSVEGPVLRVRGRLMMERTDDRTAHPARFQELPAVYTNGPLHRLIAYTGPNPWRGEPAQTIEDRPAPGQPWIRVPATEGWSALVADDGFGLGVWSPTCVMVNAGFAGERGVGGEFDNPTGYLAPSRSEVLDANIVYDFSYAIVVGEVETIRASAERLRRQAFGTDRPAAWQFTDGRAGWWSQNVTDTGFPWPGVWEVTSTTDDPQLVSPEFCQPIEAADGARRDMLVITASVTTRTSGETIPPGELFVSLYDQPGFSSDRKVDLPWPTDGSLQEIRLDLSAYPWWRGSVTGLRLDPFAGTTDATFRLHSVRFETRGLAGK